MGGTFQELFFALQWLDALAGASSQCCQRCQILFLFGVQPCQNLCFHKPKVLYVYKGRLRWNCDRRQPNLLVATLKQREDVAHLVAERSHRGNPVLIRQQIVTSPTPHKLRRVPVAVTATSLDNLRMIWISRHPE